MKNPALAALLSALALSSVEGCSPPAAVSSGVSSSAPPDQPGIAILPGEGVTYRPDTGYYTIAFFGTNSSATGAVYSLGWSNLPGNPTPLSVLFYMKNEQSSLLLGSLTPPATTLARNHNGWAWGLFTLTAVAYYPGYGITSPGLRVNCYMTNYRSPEVSGLQTNGSGSNYLATLFRFDPDEEFNSQGNYAPGTVIGVYLGCPANAWATNGGTNNPGAWTFGRVSNRWELCVSNMVPGSHYKYVVWTTNSAGVTNPAVWVHDCVNYRVVDDNYGGLNSFVP